ncbi:hypothetical protein AgCh_014486 [Apium graveolens]
MQHGDVAAVGMAALGTHATRLKNLSCRYCGFGAKPLNALLSHSSSLQTVSLCRFEPRELLIYPGAAADSLKSIRLKHLSSNPQWFEPLLIGSKNLTSLRINQCHWDWSGVLNMVASRDNCVFKVSLYEVEVIKDIGLSALSNSSKLEYLNVTSCYRSLNDEALIAISNKCLNLTTFKLTDRCHLVTHLGMAALGMHAKRLKEFWCKNCNFGPKELNALVFNSSSLQKISVKDLHGVHSADLIYPCAEGSSLKSICLENLYENHWPQCFAPLITRSKNLTSLTLLRCKGKWDNVFRTLATRESSLCEVNLNEVHVTDAALSALCSFSKLEILHVIATPDCTNRGIVSVVEHCKLLRKLHVEKRRMKQNLKKIACIQLASVMLSFRLSYTKPKQCSNLTTFKLDNVTVFDVGMAASGTHATRLKNFSSANCWFGANSMNALLSHSSPLEAISFNVTILEGELLPAVTASSLKTIQLKNEYPAVRGEECSNVLKMLASKENSLVEEISVKFLRGDSTQLINPCALGSSLKSIHLKDLYGDHWPRCFAPLITGSKYLTSCRLLLCFGNWDDVLYKLANGDNSLPEVYLNRVQVTDAGLSALSSFSKLECLRKIGTPNCTNACILSVVKQCKLLRKLHIDSWRTKWNLGKDGLFSIGKHNAKLQVVKHWKKMNVCSDS